MALEDAFRGYKDKASTQEKVRVISEDFIDDIIDKRARMGLGPPPDPHDRESQSAMILQARKQNERTQKMRMLNSKTKQANVASMNTTGQTSMSTKKRTELIS